MVTCSHAVATDLQHSLSHRITYGSYSEDLACCQTLFPFLYIFENHFVITIVTWRKLFACEDGPRQLACTQSRAYKFMHVIYRCSTTVADRNSVLLHYCTKNVNVVGMNYPVRHSDVAIHSGILGELSPPR